MATFQALAAKDNGGKLAPFSYEVGELGPEEVEIKVDYCGICHSDLSMALNEWQMTAYPFVPGHEVSGTVAAAGPLVKGIEVGQRVGLGWFTHSCLHCHQCLSGNHNLCPTAEQTIVGRHGGFADRVRAHWEWTIPLPEGIDYASAGPLFCGGITVFNPIVQNNIRPTDRVAVIGIGGLGHMALQFLRAWGCEVTAISTSPEKEAYAKELGAHHFVNSKDTGALEKLQGRFHMILSTINVDLDGDLYLGMLAPRGTLHYVGAAASHQHTVFVGIMGAKSISHSPLGSPATTREMVDFAARHGLAPRTEILPMSKANEALEILKTKKIGHRLVLQCDL